jgi:hypothetical protein
MRRNSVTVFVGLFLFLLLTSCSSSPAPKETVTVTATQTRTQTQSGTPTGLASPTDSPSGAFTASPNSTESPTAAGPGNSTPSALETPTGSVTGTPDSGRTVVVNGKNYTCSELIGTQCDNELSDAFSRWGENIDSFSRSKYLGPLVSASNAPLTIGGATRLGLLACIDSAGNYDSEKFAEDAKQIVPDAPRNDLLPIWFEAQKTLCPDVPFRS